MRMPTHVLLLFLVGCASSTPGTTADVGGARSGATRIRSVGEDFSESRITSIRPEVDQVSIDIPGSAQATWDALNQVYADLEIEVEGRDSRAMALNNTSFSVSRRLGGERLSKFFRCGTGMSGANADRFRIQINIYSRVQAVSPEMSILETTIQAFGTNPEGTSNTRVACGSTHQLEYRMATAVKELVGG